jgi:hypothetical protein
MIQYIIAIKMMFMRSYIILNKKIRISYSNIMYNSYLFIFISVSNVILKIL